VRKAIPRQLRDRTTVLVQAAQYVKAARKNSTNIHSDTAKATAEDLRGGN